MRHASLLLLVVACHPPRDSDSYDPTVCTDPQPAPSPSCSDLPSGAAVCGDGVRQSCWLQQSVDSPCPSYFKIDEACDGADVPSCASLGLGLGTVVCNDTCMANTSACGACGDDPRVIACTVAPLSFDRLLVASDPAAAGGPYLALANRGGRVDVLQRGPQGFSDVGGLQGDVVAVAAAGDGWFVAVTTPTHELHVGRTDARMTTTTDAVVATPASLGAVSIAYGPGGRALLAWVEYVPDASSVMHPQTRFAVLDATGVVIVAPATLFASTDDAAGTSVSRCPRWRARRPSREMIS